VRECANEIGIIDAYIGYSDGTVDCASGWIPEDPTWKSNERPWYKGAIEGNEGDSRWSRGYR